MAKIDQFYTSRERYAKTKIFDPGRIYLAKVKDTRNVMGAGELKVYIIGSELKEDDPSNWVTASYASSFFGTTPHNNNTDVSSYTDSPKSFGAWFPIPAIDNLVFIFYPMVSGETAHAFWFACPVDPSVDYMLPGIPGAFGKDDHKPLCERNNYNDDNDRELNKETIHSENRQSVYLPLNNALITQGLENDKLRGISTASTKRESPSMCYGFLTPLGNSFVMDDGWENTDNRTTWNSDNSERSRNLVNNEDGLTPFQRTETNRHNAGFRMRTRNGTQILVSDNGNIYMINRDGSCWVEISDDGYLDAYAKKGVNISSEGDINLHTKGMIKMEADKGFAFKAGKSAQLDTTEEGVNGGFSFDSVGDFNIHTPHIITDSVISSQEINAGKGNIGTFTSMGGNISGTFAGTLQGTAFYATSAGIISSKQPIPETPNPEIPNVVLETKRSVEGQGDERIGDTINSRIPTHEPYSGHNRNNLFPKLNIKKGENNYEGMMFESEYTNNSNTIQSNVVCSIPNAPQIDENIPNQSLTEHFSLAQMCASDTARRKNINNMPINSEIVGDLRLLCQNILEAVRKHYNKPIIVNSGYRGPTLNAAVGGSKTSQHCKGQAADIEIAGVSNYELACWIRDNLDFDQLILEYANNLPNDANSGWVHVSFNKLGNRKQCLTIKSAKSGYQSGLII